MFGLLMTCTDWEGVGRCSSNTTCHISQPLHNRERFTLLMKSFACQLLSNKSTDSYGTYGMRLTLHFWHFGGRLLLGWGREGEKKTGQELWNECQESKRQRGRDWKWKDDPSLADSHRVAQQVGGARQLHRNTHKKTDCSLICAHKQCSAVDPETKNLSMICFQGSISVPIFYIYK